MNPDRSSKCCWTVSALIIWMSVSAEPHSGDRLYPIAYLSDEMLAEILLTDGQIYEWMDLLGEPTMTLLDFKDGLELSTPNPADLDFRIWLAWHDEPPRFYVAVVASDDVYHNNHDYHGLGLESLIQMNDSIMLAVDGDHSGGMGWSPFTDKTEWELVEGMFGQTQYYEAIARTPAGPTLDDQFTRVYTGEFAWTVFPPYAESGGGVFGEAPFISVTELYVTPFDRWEGVHSSGGIQASDLTAGQVVGFSIAVVDHDEPVDDIWEVWVPEAMEPVKETVFIDMRDLLADTFLDGILRPGAATEPEGDTAVGAVSWGRIKASLEFE